METIKAREGGVKIHKFLALIPHRDSARILEEYRRKLFSSGFAGAYSFPALAPLALVSRPFTRNELKETARAIRESSLINGGKIGSAGTGIMQRPAGAGEFPLFGGDTSFFGPLLDLHWDEETSKLFPQEEAGQTPVLFRFPKPILCAAMLGTCFLTPGENSSTEPPEAPALSFSAAMLANLSVAEAGPLSLKWKLSEPVWLPPLQGKKSGKLLRH